MANITPEMRETLENAPYPRLLGLHLLELADGYAKVGVATRPEHASFLGVTDGSLVMSLADYAIACSSNASGQTRVAVQSNTNFIATPAVGSELIAEARIVHAGRTLAIVDTNVTDATGRLVAKSTGTVIARPNQGAATK